MEIKNTQITGLMGFLGEFLHGKDQGLRLALLTFFTKGHLLIEDLPGLGKTTLAIGLAKALGLSFGRIQCTNDLLPTDVTGLSIYNKDDNRFEFQRGPVFNNIVLVDEVNRATPKTQSALLEAMGEKQVTAEGSTYNLNRPFFVIATQNPVDQFGTFPLPESQLDRFMMKISLGYPNREAERIILSGGSRRRELYDIAPLLSQAEIEIIQKEIEKDVQAADKIIDYVLDIAQATRSSRFLRAGLSTRATLFMIRLGKANAYFKGRDYVIPEDIKELSPYIITHRVLFNEEFQGSDRDFYIRSLIDEVNMPA
ncbi:AAA family ATPase [Geovibrio thiophilus]|uniref:AAA family ATPase n=1 Tax=Geovibrio thiophilus TaxID=139438 RepID=A0A410JXE6_9BACT|nr:AAA family ATPase [Geovibrio thiophilus]QAR32840.1 AAA family ATPase [Geovibrio thiophilus]